MLPYEIHVTVEWADVDQFKIDCADIGVKPIILELHTSGRSFADMQTSSVFKGDDITVFDELSRIQQELHDRGYDVIRGKIETSPDHPLAQVVKDGKLLIVGHYFEQHFNITCDRQSNKTLHILSKLVDGHLSRNMFKKVDGERFQTMMTLRDSCSFELFKARVDKIARGLRDLGYPVNKEITEFALYDSNLGHDTAWVS